MSLHVTADDISTAWANALATVNDHPGGTATHLLVAIGHPDADDDPSVTAVVDEMLRRHEKQSVTTVANTLFPSALYDAPDWGWSPDLPPEQVEPLDIAAADLYEVYLDMLPQLRRVGANKFGTYFSRMIAWPGKTGTGTNQLQKRIEHLRTERRNGNRTSNVSDLAIAGDADGANAPDGTIGGLLEEYAVTDTRTQGFPCLVHIDISVRNGALSVLGVYRHWHLITRGYGNLVGLARLQAFLCQQTGFTPGELAVVAGHANAEHADYSGRAGVNAILRDINGALQAEPKPTRASP